MGREIPEAAKKLAGDYRELQMAGSMAGGYLPEQLTSMALLSVTRSLDAFREALFPPAQGSFIVKSHSSEMRQLIEAKPVAGTPITIEGKTYDFPELARNKGREQLFWECAEFLDAVGCAAFELTPA